MTVSDGDTCALPQQNDMHVNRCAAGFVKGKFKFKPSAISFLVLYNINKEKQWLICGNTQRTIYLVIILKIMKNLFFSKAVSVGLNKAC